MTLAFATVEEAFRYCRDMDASLSERLETLANVSRALRPEMQEAVDRMVDRLKAHHAGEAAPKPGESMPPFTLPDETGRLAVLTLFWPLFGRQDARNGDDTKGGACCLSGRPYLMEVGGNSSV